MFVRNHQSIHRWLEEKERQRRQHRFYECEQCLPFIHLAAQPSLYVFIERATDVRHVDLSDNEEHSAVTRSYRTHVKSSRRHVRWLELVISYAPKETTIDDRLN